MPFNIAGGELLNLALNRTTYQISAATSDLLVSHGATGMTQSQL